MMDTSDFPEVPRQTPSSAKDALLTEHYKGLVAAWAAEQAARIAEAQAAADDTRKIAGVDQAARIAEAQAAADDTRKIAGVDQAARIAEAQAAADSARALVASRFAADVALEKAEFDSEYELMKSFHVAVVDLAKGAVDRARATGQFVQTASSAIAGLYTGVLAFMIVVAKTPLPPRGLIPVVFLGLAIALSVGYLAFLGGSASIAGLSPQASRRATQLARTAMFVRFVNATVLNRAALIRGSVICLGAGTLFLPIGLVSVEELAAWIAAVIVLIVIVGLVTFWSFQARSSSAR